MAAYLEQYKQEGYFRALYVYYSKDRRWETEIFSKHWKQITEEEHLALGILQTMFNIEGNQADLDLLNQHMALIEQQVAEYQAAAEPTARQKAIRLFEEFKDDPSITKLLQALQSGVPIACDSFFGKDKKNLIRTVCEGLTIGTTKVIGFGDKLTRYTLAGGVKVMENIPGLKMLVTDSMSDFATVQDKEFVETINNLVSGIKTNMSMPCPCTGKNRSYYATA